MTENPFEKTAKLGREFDGKLLALRNDLCEPSRLGSGLKTYSALETIDKKASDLLADVSKMNGTLQAQLREMERRSNNMTKFITDMERTLNRAYK